MTTFQAPLDISQALEQRIRTKLLNAAFYECKQNVGLIGQLRSEAYFRRTSPLLAITTNNNRTISRIDISYKFIADITDAQTKKAIDLLEDRICRNLGESDKITEINLRLGAEDLIEGTVRGAAGNGRLFTIAVQMIWNYRYGENSANGVLTIYPQFRGTRSGEPMEGKAQQSPATAAKEAAKAQRDAAKTARRQELRAKFSKTPERLAREMEKSLKDWRDDHPTSPQWAFVRDAARALTEEQLDEMFQRGARTSWDIESRLEREYLTQKNAVA